MRIPKHVALIPDGNRRWAESRRLKPWDGHREGIERFKEFLDWCYDSGVEEITAYSMSKENLSKRKQEEVGFLFKLYEKNLIELLKSPKVIERGVRVEFAGNLEPFPKAVKDLIKRAESETKKFKKRKLTLCLNYSGRDEILQAAKNLGKSKKPWTEANLEKHLQVTSAPDLLIRTAERRISNFLLWQCAYSEIYFSEKFFPDFTKNDFMDAIKQYDKTQRRYGK